MGENSKIEWTDNTFNPWWGCTRVSEGCVNCYAETFARRFGVQWGPQAERRMAGPDMWAKPLAWNRKAKREGVRRRVFCASMADVFEVGTEYVNWVICGGESGHGARPMQPDWALDLRNQCMSAGVPFFFKQWGGVNKQRAGRTLDGRTWDEVPRLKCEVHNG